jgi:hypothetical protein
VKVGRPALDEEAIRWIEEHNPDIEFNWPQILEAQPAALPNPEDPRNRRRRDRPERRSAAPRPARPAAPAPLPAVPAGEALPDVEARREPVTAQAPDVEEAAERELDETQTDVIEALESVEPDAVAPPQDVGVEGVDDEEEIENTLAPTALEQVTGREQLTRLRARYAELLTRISERGGDAERAAALRAEAETLNPDLWVTEEEARIGVAAFEPKIRELRAALGLRRRRRSRRGGRRHAGPRAPGEADS